MAVRVVDIGVPVAARHVAADALDAHLLLLEIAVRVDDFFEAAALPGDLVDRHLGSEFAVAALVHHRLREQHHRVMIGAVAHEIAMRIAEPGILRKPRGSREIGLVRDREAQEIAVEMPRLFELDDIEAEMPEAADFERPLQEDAADIVAMPVASHDPVPP